MNTALGKKKVLIVDDEESIVVGLTVALEKAGYEVLSAYTGEKGLQLARQEKPDVILLDVFLPGEDGLAIMKQLKRPLDPETADRSQLRETPVIVITGRGEKMEEMFQMEKAFAFFTKPFELNALISSVRKAIQSRKP